MKRETKAAVLVFLLGLVLCWYGGADLAERSFENAFYVFECLLASAAAYCFGKAHL